MPRYARRLLVTAAVLGCAVCASVPAYATFPGENGKIVFSKDGDLWTINADGSGLTQITSGPRNDSQPKWSPDGSMISFSGLSGPAGDAWSPGYDGYDVFVWHADGSATRFGAPHVDYYDHAWSPDRHLVFSTEQNAVNYGGPPGQSSNLVVSNLAGGNARVIVKTLFPAADPDWSPLDDRIVLLLHYDGSVIYFVNRDGTHLTNFNDQSAPTDEIPESSSPSWSPNGSRLAWAGGQGFDAQHCSGVCVFTANPDGTDLQRLTADPAVVDSDPVWSPDGSQIAFTHHANWGDPSEIWIMDSNGQNAYFLTEGSGPDWQPRVPPHALASPGFSGVAREGQALTARPGSWFATPELAYTYRWSLCDGARDNCVEIADATEKTYMPTSNDVMHRLRVTVTATNDLGQSAAQSGPSSVVGDVIFGTGASDLLRGTPGADTAKGLGGNDLLGLGGSNDLGRGGPGNDLLVGGAGADVLVGGPGRDRLRGGSGRDRIFASDGARDLITCGPGRDFVIADRRDFVAANCEIVRYW